VLTATNALDGTGADIDRIRRAAREMQKIVLELADEILHPAVVKTPVAETPKPAPAAPKKAPATAKKPEPVVNSKEPSWEEEEEGTFDSPFD
jgi:hypothetical protein